MKFTTDFETFKQIAKKHSPNGATVRDMTVCIMKTDADCIRAVSNNMGVMTTTLHRATVERGSGNAPIALTIKELKRLVKLGLSGTLGCAANDDSDTLDITAPGKGFFSIKRDTTAEKEWGEGIEELKTSLHTANCAYEVKDIVAMLDLVKDCDREVFRGAFFTNSCLLATNGHYLVAKSYESGVEIEWDDLSAQGRKIPLDALKSLQAFAKSDTMLSKGEDGALWIDTSGARCRIPSVREKGVPSFERVVPRLSEVEFSIVGKLKDFKTAMKQAAVHCKENKLGLFRLQGASCTVTAECDQSSMERTLSVENLSNDERAYSKIGFNIMYMARLLDLLQGETVSISWQDCDSPMLIEGLDNKDDGLKIVLMPMQV